MEAVPQQKSDPIMGWQYHESTATSLNEAAFFSLPKIAKVLIFLINTAPTLLDKGRVGQYLCGLKPLLPL